VEVLPESGVRAWHAWGGAIVLLAGSEDPFAERVAPVLERRCLECHDAATAKGELVLEGLADGDGALARGAELWERVRERVASGEMPPARRDPLAPGEREALLEWIDGRFPAAPAPAPLLRRLNDLEYRRAVRDLFGLEFRTEGRFPRDGVAHGFSTSAEALALSTLELELYLEAALEIAGRAVAVDDTRTPLALRRAAGELTSTNQPELLRPADEAGGLPARLALPSERQRAGTRVVLPRRGAYRVELELAAQPAGRERARAALVVDGVDRGEGELGGDLAAGVQRLAFELELEGGPRRLEVRFANDHYDPEHPDPAQRDRNLFVVAIGVTGPLDPPRPSAFQEDLERRFPPALGERRLPDALAHLVRRVWRRPARAGEVERLARLSADGAPFDQRLARALAALLASPNFLYRVEVEPVEEEGAGGRLDDCELVARLAAFLWSSVPDERLDAAAERGGLDDDARLLELADELVADERSDGLALGFALPWLQLGGLDSWTPDRERFGEFDAELAASMREESVRLFLDVLRERRSAWALLEADWTFVDRRLAELYGLDPPPADGFARASLARQARRGLLGHAGVLAATSMPTRTSPVRRGKWVLEVLLGAPPPAPPPGVAALVEDAPGSVRERTEAHAANPDCAACHARMDPLGFGLEVFDPLGRARDQLAGHPIDARGTLPDGRTFDGPLGLVELLRADGRFPRALLEKLCVYAWGRALVPADRARIGAMLARLDPKEPTLAGMVREIVLSEPFRARPARPAR